MSSPSVLRSFGAAALCLFVISLTALNSAQPARAQLASSLGADRTAPGPNGSSRSTDGLPGSSETMPDAPNRQFALDVHPFVFPAARAATEHDRPWDVTPAGSLRQEPFSRIGVGAGVSPLGIGANAAVVLTEYFDGRLTGNFFRFNNGHFEADGVNVTAGLHLASGAASLDFYPFNSPIRLSAGLMFYNTNHVSGTLRVASGTGFTLNGDSFFAGAAGSTPLTGVAAIALHAIRPAPTLTFGFGKFIPRSNRHWSTPAEFGVAFTGAPTVNVAMAGTVCSDPLLTTCGEISDTSNPVAAKFNSDLKAKLVTWRSNVGRVQIFPIFSYGVSYSFNTPWQGSPKAKF